MKYYPFAHCLWACLLLFGLLLFCNPVWAAERVSLTLHYDDKQESYNQEKIFIKANEQLLQHLPMEPIVMGDVTYVPIREVFESLGAVVDWKQETKQVYIGYGSNLIVLTINSHEININGGIMQMKVAPKVINDKAMIPIRIPAEALGFVVDWHSPTRTVIISSPVIATPTPISTPKTTAIPPSPTPTNTQLPFLPTPSPSSTPPNTTMQKAVDISAEPIKTIQNLECGIIDVLIPTGNELSNYTIIANAPITKVDKMLLPDNRLVLDIHNAVLQTTKTSYEIQKPHLKSIRLGQNQVVPVKITRIVLDLTSAVHYQVNISPDRKQLYVTFEQNTISDVSFKTDGNTDFLVFKGLASPTVLVSYIPNQNHLVIDLPIAKISSLVDLPVSGVFAKHIKTQQLDTNTARAVIELKDTIGYEVLKNENETTIKFHKVGYQNIFYDAKTNTIVLSKPKGANQLANVVTQNDEYFKKLYTITLPENYEDHFGNGEMFVQNEFLSSISISTVNKKTQLQIKETRVLVFTITEDVQNLYIKAQLPKEKYEKIVVIDPGHGLQDNGASANGMKEKELNLDISKKLIALLEADPSVKVYATRVDDSYPTREERAQFANEVGDIFVSIHNNAYNGIAKGTETYYLPHQNDAALGISSKTLADIFQKNLIDDLDSFDRKVKNDAKYVVLVLTEIPAVLVEIGFMDQPEDAAKLATDAYRQKAAQSLYRSIKEIFSLYQPIR